MISKELENVLNIFFTKGSNSLGDALVKQEKKEVIDLLNQILYLYANDKNSSTIREYITVKLAGYKPSLKKIGFNGERGDEKCDAKPLNVDTSATRKHNGGGNFTDFRYNRLKNYMEHDLKILVSGFTDGRLIFILEFPFNYSLFYKKLKKQLDKYYKEGKDIKNVYLRGASFTYKDYKDCPVLKTHYLNKELLVKFSKFFTKDFYRFLSASLFSVKRCF